MTEEREHGREPTLDLIWSGNACKWGFLEGLSESFHFDLPAGNDFPSIEGPPLCGLILLHEIQKSSFYAAHCDQPNACGNSSSFHQILKAHETCIKIMRIMNCTLNKNKVNVEAKDKWKFAWTNRTEEPFKKKKKELKKLPEEITIKWRYQNGSSD